MIVYCRSSLRLVQTTHPKRVPDFLPAWRGMFGERVRSAVHGIAEPMFDIKHIKRPFLNMQLHIVNNPDMIGHVLLDNHTNYIRPKLTRKILSDLIGNGLLNAEGEDWRTQRRLVAPSFSPHAVDAASSLMAEATQAHLAGWPTTPQRIDMAQVATQTTAAIIAKALFSDDPRLTSNAAAAHIDRCISAAGQPRLLMMLGLRNLDPSPSMIRARQSRHWLRETLGTMVQERGPEGGDDFFGGLMRAFHSDMPKYEAESLSLDNALTFYAAGYETTAVTLTWASYLLAAQPEVQDMLREEARSAVNGPALSLPQRVPELRKFLDETLRLYPPVLQIIREAVADDDICGVPVKQGELIFIYPWIVQRHRALWDAPDSFDAERFSSDGKACQHRFQFIPFGAGPRICVGMRFAINEALIILAHWLSTKKFSLPKGFKPLPYGTVTLRPKDGMPLFVESV